MNATKEKCREAIVKLEETRVVTMSKVTTDLERSFFEDRFNMLAEFLACAEKRLPTERSFKKDRQRKRTKK
jgi:hypothetical protein